MNTEEKPRPSMIGVVGKYSYVVKSECFVADTPDYEIADSLLEVTSRDDAPWRAIPVKQLFSEGKGRALKSWIVTSDNAPACAMYYSGSSAVHIKPMPGTAPASPAKGEKRR